MHQEVAFHLAASYNALSCFFSSATCALTANFAAFDVSSCFFAAYFCSIVASCSLLLALIASLTTLASPFYSSCAEASYCINFSRALSVVLLSSSRSRFCCSSPSRSALAYSSTFRAAGSPSLVSPVSFFILVSYFSYSILPDAKLSF